MDAFYELFYRPGLDLKLVGIVIGAWLILSHGYALMNFEKLKPVLEKFPRNYNVGVPLLVIAFIWTFMVWSSMDLGEFWKMEKAVQVILVVGCFAMAFYVKDFISVRAVGLLMILAAAPMLISAFQQPPITRLLLVFIAYVMIVKGMFWVGKPYLMRDQIAWVVADKKRWQIACGAGLAYGIVMLICALLFWGKAVAAPIT